VSGPPQRPGRGPNVACASMDSSSELARRGRARIALARRGRESRARIALQVRRVASHAEGWFG
jgi:hypothetical protein